MKLTFLHFIIIAWIAWFVSTAIVISWIMELLTQDVYTREPRFKRKAVIGAWVVFLLPFILGMFGL